MRRGREKISLLIKLCGRNFSSLGFNGDFAATEERRMIGIVNSNSNFNPDRDPNFVPVRTLAPPVSSHFLPFSSTSENIDQFMVDEGFFPSLEDGAEREKLIDDLREVCIARHSPIAFNNYDSSTICRSKMSTTHGQSVPVCRKFIPVEQSEILSTSKHDGFKFSLVSYNILAQTYVKSSLYPHSPSSCLKWKARSQSILAVLKALDADFLCLQELDEYDTFYKENIEKDGYSSIYAKIGKRVGCGIFYKLNKSELVMEEKIDFNDLVDMIEDKETFCNDQDKIALGRSNDGLPKDGLGNTKGNRGDLNDPRIRLKRDCVGVMAAFKLKNPSQHFVIVTNSDFYWDPELADVKLAQAKYLLSRASKFKTLISNTYKCSPSVIIAGDFNSLPGDKVYQYVLSGSSSLPECSEKAPIPLASVYACTRGEPVFTNCTPGFKGTLDYIFFTPSGESKPVGFLELPETESPDVKGGLPNFFHPSDHLPIGAEFLVV